MSRTMKLLTAFSYAVKVVSISWLDDSHKNGKFLPFDDYIPRNKASEKKWNFSIKSTLHNASIARQSGGILAGYSIYVQAGVLVKGARLPPVTELRILLRAAGADVLVSQTALYSCADPAKVILLIFSTKDELKSPRLKEAAKNGSKIVTLEKLLLALTQQSIENLFEDINQPSKKSMPKSPTEDGINPLSKNGAPPKSRAPSTEDHPEMHPKSKAVPKASKKKISPESKPRRNALGKSVDTHRTAASKVNLGSVLEKHGFYMKVQSDNKANQSPVKDVVPSPVKEIIQSPVKKVVQSPVNEIESPNKTTLQSSGGANKKDDPFEVICQIKLTISPERTTSRSKRLKQVLGQGGILYFLKSLKNGRIRAKYIVNGVEMFDSIVPLPDEVHKFVKGNAGYENVFYWNALNKAHAAGGTLVKGATTPSTSVGLRRVYFWFDSPHALTVALYFLFDQDTKLVEEFFNKDGRFTVKQKTLPPHIINHDDDEMDTDDDGIEIDEAPDTAGEVEDGFDPQCESQLY